MAGKCQWQVAEQALWRMYGGVWRVSGKDQSAFRAVVCGGCAIEKMGGTPGAGGSDGRDWGGFAE